MRKLVVIVCLFLSAIPLFAQPEERIYRRTLESPADSRVIYHHIIYYVFKKQDKKDLKGSFIEVSFQPIEMRRNYRVGTFKERDDLFSIEYNDSDINDTVVYSYNKHLSEDTIYIQWQNFAGRVMTGFSVSIYDEYNCLDTTYESLYPKPWHVRIPREKYDFNKFKLYFDEVFLTIADKRPLDIPPCGINEIKIRMTGETDWKDYNEAFKYQILDKNQLEELK